LEDIEKAVHSLCEHGASPTDAARAFIAKYFKTKTARTIEQVCFSLYSFCYLLFTLIAKISQARILTPSIVSNWID
jgi:hypothetical protein